MPICAEFCSTHAEVTPGAWPVPSKDSLSRPHLTTCMLICMLQVARLHAFLLVLRRCAFPFQGTSWAHVGGSPTCYCPHHGGCALMSEGCRRWGVDYTYWSIWCPRSPGHWLLHRILFRFHDEREVNEWVRWLSVGLDMVGKRIFGTFM